VKHKKIKARRRTTFVSPIKVNKNSSRRRKSQGTPARRRSYRKSDSDNTDSDS